MKLILKEVNLFLRAESWTTSCAQSKKTFPIDAAWTHLLANNDKSGGDEKVFQLHVFVRLDRYYISCRSRTRTCKIGRARVYSLFLHISPG